MSAFKPGPWVSDALGAHWHAYPPGCGDKGARPLVVIDPEDREHRERLMSAMRVQIESVLRLSVDDSALARLSDHLCSALREFADPTPPSMSEPGLWAVVEATVDGIPRRRWVHHEEDRWVCDTGERRYWEDLADPELIREGVTQ